jgi:hypothetical protein
VLSSSVRGRLRALSDGSREDPTATCRRLLIGIFISVLPVLQFRAVEPRRLVWARRLKLALAMIV